MTESLDKDVRKSNLGNNPVKGDVSSTPRTRTARFKYILGWTFAATMGTALWLLGRGPQPPLAAAAVADVPRLEGDKIVFSEAFASRIELEYAAVQSAPLTPVVSVVGTVAFDPEHTAAVGTRLRGLVRSVRKFEGDVVTKGEQLADVESAELGQAQAAVFTLQAEFKAAEINAQRERELRDKQLSTAREYELAQAELAKSRALLQAAKQRVVALGSSADAQHSASLGRHAIRAPISGNVIERHISTGQSVDANLVAFYIADLDRLWVELAVFERSLAHIQLGDKVAISPLANPNEHFEGRVEHIAARIDPDTRSAEVRVTFDNRKRKLRPGQAVTAKIEASQGAERAVLSLPNEAITVIDGQPTVFIQSSVNAVRPVPVKLGATSGARREITDGVIEGDAVVVSGVFALKSELFR